MILPASRSRILLLLDSGSAASPSSEDLRKKPAQDQRPDEAHELAVLSLLSARTKHLRFFPPALQEEQRRVPAQAEPVSSAGTLRKASPPPRAGLISQHQDHELHSAWGLASSLI